MPGTFFGIEIGRTGLQAAQIGQDVTGNNIANAGTEGYSVQSADQVQTESVGSADHALPLPGEALGTGVAVSRIARARDQFLDQQVRDASSGKSAQAGLGDALKQVDDAFGEPSDTGLNNALGRFFNSLQDLANNPEDVGVRATTIQKGDALARVFQGVQQRLASVGATLDKHVAADLQSVNDYGSQIAALNVTIKQQNVEGHPVNGLLDRRDLLLDKLAVLANITVQPNADSTVNVAVGTTPLVLGADAYPITQAALTAGGDLQSGELAGLVRAQGEVAAYQDKQNALAGALAARFNAAHRAGAGLDGTTGQDFFSVTAGQEAGTLAVNPALAAHPEQLAAAARPAPPAPPVPPPGDSANAALLGALKDKTVAAAGDALAGSSLSGFYQQTVSDAGGKAAGAKTAEDSAGATLTQLSQQRASVVGVSTDSEMVNMMKYQRAYQASARVVQTMDDMVGTLINDLFSRN